MDTSKYIFMSYSRKDAEIAEKIALEIDSRLSVRVWLDHKEVQAGEKWEEKIGNALKNSAAVMTLISPRYSDSKWFVMQAEAAQALNIPLIPVMIDTVPYSTLPAPIRNIQIVRYPEGQEKLFQAIIILFEKEQSKKTKQKPLVVAGGTAKKGTPRKKIDVPTPESSSQENVSPESSAKESSSPDVKRPLLEDKTPFHKDSPSSIDYLGRKGFVEALSQWIDRYWEEYKNADKSFIINLHGQWGAGKTTFLNLLQKDLQNNSNNQWTVVWFNAWENRHIKPEWWPLMDKIYRDFVAQKKANKDKKVWQIELQEWWRRFYSGRKWELLGFIASAVLLSFIFYWVMRTGFLPDKDLMSRVEVVAKAIGLVFSAISTIFLGTRFVSQTLSSGSAKAAEVYLQLTPDPIETIKRHFNDLVENKINNPVIVFIDDLDRCDREYLVNLLESVQTILNHKKVFYVIAADQRWLFAAFEETYKEFKDSVKEPGKKIGYLFLEKIFQLSVSIPNVSDEARAVYLDYLLGKEEQIEAKRDQIKKDVASVEKNDQAYIEKIQSQAAGTIEKVLMREVVVSKMASVEIEKKTIHFLSSFAHLMEPNPRSIKRLVTFYGVLRAMAILSDESIISDLTKRNQLALWTIVKMRWPLLADYLEEYPQYLNNFKTGKSNKAIHADLKDLIKDQEVMDVLSGKGINTELNAEALKRFTSLKATERTF